MKFRKVVLIFVVVAAFAFVWMRQGGDYRNMPPTADGDWIAYGDSLTSGVGAGDGNDYPTLLARQLGFKIHNYGVAGNTTEDGLNRLDTALQLKPRVVLLCLGGNDGLRGLPASHALENLGVIIDSFHDSGSFVVLIGVRSASLRDKNAQGFKQLAGEKKVFYIPDILDGVMGRPSLMSDYIHPNDAGYRAIADRLADELRPVLDKIR
ncbi:MAG: arylesterase [Verrucomicrobia bacterium]|nr:arylesterase [Verrucomicrobiota bacterium]